MANNYQLQHLLQYDRNNLILLSFLHIFIITLSNYLVQFPLSLFGFHATLAELSFPFIFLITDLTIRLFGAPLARKIIFYNMLPALICSYFFTVLFEDGVWLGWSALLEPNMFVTRIVIASFSAYALGQLMDINVFNRLRKRNPWWLAPACAATIGNALDTATFSMLALYKTSNEYLADNILEISIVAYCFKLGVSLLLLVPLYGVLLNAIVKFLRSKDNVKYQTAEY